MTNLLQLMINVGMLIIVLMVLMFVIFNIKNYLSKNLTKDQLELIRYAAEQGVKYAEQMYKTKENNGDRYQIAIDYIYDVITKAGFDYIKLSGLINGLIESEVFKLPKTHTID